MILLQLAVHGMSMNRGRGSLKNRELTDITSASSHIDKTICCLIDYSGVMTISTLLPAAMIWRAKAGVGLEMASGIYSASFFFLPWTRSFSLSMNSPASSDFIDSAR